MLGKSTPELVITDKMVSDLVNQTIEMHRKDGVMEAKAFAEQFKTWSASNRRT